MEDIDSSPPAVNTKKRPAEDEDSPEKKPLNLKGTQFVLPTPPDTDQSSNASPTFDKAISVRDASPAPSTSTLSSVDAASISAAASGDKTAPGSSSTQPPPKKRRKLTPAEKLQQQQEKETKAAEKVAEKARKEEERARKDAGKAEDRARKDEEKRVKDEEKRRKAEEREGRKREKEVKEETKAQEKLKEERKQMRLGIWLRKPATPGQESGEGETGVNARRKSVSLEPFDAVAHQIKASPSPRKAGTQTPTTTNTSLEPKESDYCKHFLRFQLPTHTSMPPRPTPASPDEVQEAFDLEVNDPSLREKYDLGLQTSYASLSEHFASERHSTRGVPLPNMRQLVDRILGSIQQPIDLTIEEPVQDPLDALQSVSRRFIAFEQDVRPAYFGTYTKICSPKTMKQLACSPFSLLRPDTDYDYDSEAEWEEEAGEDILDEEDEEAESVGDMNEMDEFLDDEDDALKNKRRLITGDLVPTNTGLCWENERNQIVPSIEDADPLPVMRGMRMGLLLSGLDVPTIDPYSTAYWEQEVTASPAAPVAKTEPTVHSDEMMPPPERPPLQSRANGNGTLDHLFLAGAQDSPGQPLGNSSSAPAKRGRKAGPKTLSTEDMEEFKGFVVGSQSSKAELLKELKTRFPKLSNEVIKKTLGDSFAQVGGTKADKRWGFVSMS